jgi:putative NADH-flavin reductase
MKLIIFGASGATGRELVREAMSAGHDVSVFVRDTSAIPSESVRTHQGDIIDALAVRGALEGQDAAMCALGAPSPFRPYPVFLDGIRNILGALEHAEVRRFIYLSFVGVPESRHQFGFLGRHLIAPRVLRHATEGHRLNEEAIKASMLDWTIVRPPKLTDGPKTSAYRTGAELRPRGVVPSLARADVAEMMVRELERREYVRRAVTVMHS